MSIQENVVDALVILAAFVIGGIPWGVVIARLTGGPDPRTIGSGRTGGANVMRALGPRAALMSGLLDVLKGIVAVIIAFLVGGGLGLEVLAAFAAIIGHSRSPFIGFKGGRGIAPAFGSLMVIHPLAALLTIPVFAGVLLATRYSSLASLTATTFAAAVIIATVVVFQLPILYAIYAIGAGGLVWLFHIDNVQRLLAGTERRIEFRQG
jgi:glycerol-3-phosphate acyltransferase PlsY